MSILESRWQAGQCRIENSICFCWGHVLLLAGSAAACDYVVQWTTNLETLLATCPDGWTDIDENCVAEFAETRISAGSGAFETKGYIACISKSFGLRWIAHFTDSETFCELSFDGRQILAVSAEYPFRYQWKIDVNQPQTLTVSKQSDLIQ